VSRQPTGPVEKPVITVAAVPSFDAAGLYIAQQRGFFTQAGLHVKIVPAISSTTVLARQLAGHIDITFGGYVNDILAMASRGTQLHLLAPGTVMSPDTQMILVPASSPIQTPAGLAGKRVAVNALHNVGPLLVDSVLSDNALPLSSVKFVPIPFPRMVSALQHHRVDAAWMPEPYVTNAEEAIGAEPIADADSGLAQSLPLVGYVCTQDWLRKYPRTAAAFADAIRRAQQIAGQSPAAVQRISARYVGITLRTASIVPAPQFELKTNPAAIQRLANLMLQFGLLPRGFNTRTFTQ
jgi:NitT/TauT family transport system substrate-binding protein